MRLLLDPETYQGVIQTLNWFVDVVKKAELTEAAENREVLMV
jgi:hypothetical protein